MQNQHAKSHVSPAPDAQLAYDVIDYRYPKAFMQEVHALQPNKTLRQIGLSWVALMAAAGVSHFYLTSFSGFWFFYPLLIFVIASRQGALLNIVHEAAHSLVSANKSWNDFLGRYLCALPIGVDFDGFRNGHKFHHLHAGTKLDPKSDTEKYRAVRFDRQLFLLFLKDLSGITALSVFFAYEGGGRKTEAQQGQGALKKLATLSAVQVIILGGLFQFNLAHYFLLWIVPAISPHMFLMRVRGIAEHGLPLQLCAQVNSGREGSNLTRSFLTPARQYRHFKFLIPVEKFFIGSIGIHYHHEHHALPGVPYYHLPKVHALLSGQLKDKHPELFDVIYERGYLSAFLAGLTRYPRC